MFNSSGVQRFRIVVETNNQIRADRNPNPVAIEDGIVKYDSLQWQTIDALVGILRENRLLHKSEFKVLGENLYSVLLDNEIGEKLKEAHYAQQRGNFLKVELEFKPGQEQLASWPWEYLYCPFKQGKRGGYFLADSNKLFLTRYITLYSQQLSLLIETLPLRVLFIAASPFDLHEVEYCSVLTELRNLQTRYSSDIFQVHELIDEHPDKLPAVYNPTVTFSNVCATIAALEPHIIHFVGHGRCINGRNGELAFMHPTENGAAEWREDSDLAKKLAEGTSSFLRLVFLQACESALSPVPNKFGSTSEVSHHNPYQAISGVARNLAEQFIPAVIGMQYRIKESVANLFARTFYQALLQARGIEIAVQEGRLEILKQAGNWFGGSSFGLPVLYLQQSGSLLEARPDAGHIAMKSGPIQAPDVFQKTAIGGLINPVSSQVPHICPNCGARHSTGKKYCNACGNSLICIDCGTQIIKTQQYCSRCGAKLKLG